MAAYEAYWRGMFYYRKLNRDDMEVAMKYFELAKEKDPGFALAYAGIGRVWRGSQQIGIVKVADGAPKAEAAVIRALELDSTYSEVHHLLGGIRTWTNWDWKGGEASYRKAIELNPQNADAHSTYSHLLSVLGRSDEAMKHIAIALDLDPINSKILSFYGVDLMFARRYDDAVKAFQKALDLDPEQGLGINIISALYFAGREDEATEMLKKFPKNMEFLYAIDEGYNEGGFQGAVKKLADARAERSKTMYIDPYGVAYEYALAADIDNAIHWLEKAYEEHSPNLPYLLSPTFDILRNNPRFQEIARKMNLPYK
jgi:tetratricopeptide (TPR) repeat protein